MWSSAQLCETTWGQRWLKEKKKRKRKTSTRMLIFIKLHCLLTLLSKWQERTDNFTAEIFDHCQTPVSTYCAEEEEKKMNRIIVYAESISVTLGRIHKDPNGCMRNNKHSLISQFFLNCLSKLNSCLGTCFKEQACLSKASSVNKQNKRDDGWLLNPHLISANVQLFKVSCAPLICFKAEEK